MMMSSLTQRRYIPAHFIAAMGCIKGGGWGREECVNVVSMQFKLEQPPPPLHPLPVGKKLQLQLKLSSSTDFSFYLFSCSTTLCVLIVAANYVK